MEPLYQDDRITCDEEGVRIGRYYFPTGGEKRIPYEAIRGFTSAQMGLWTGKGRIWGSSDLRHWLNLDWRRPSKERLIVLELDGWVRPVITPDDPDAVLRILREKTGIAPVDRDA